MEKEGVLFLEKELRNKESNSDVFNPCGKMEIKSEGSGWMYQLDILPEGVVCACMDSKLRLYNKEYELVKESNEIQMGKRMPYFYSCIYWKEREKIVTSDYRGHVSIWNKENLVMENSLMVAGSGATVLWRMIQVSETEFLACTDRSVLIDLFTGRLFLVNLENEENPHSKIIFEREFFFLNQIYQLKTKPDLVLMNSNYYDNKDRNLKIFNWRKSKIETDCTNEELKNCRNYTSMMTRNFSKDQHEREEIIVCLSGTGKKCQIVISRIEEGLSILILKKFKIEALGRCFKFLTLPASISSDTSSVIFIANCGLFFFDLWTEQVVGKYRTDKAPYHVVWERYDRQEKRFVVGGNPKDSSMICYSFNPPETGDLDLEVRIGFLKGYMHGLNDSNETLMSKGWMVIRTSVEEFGIFKFLLI